jgi:hypothetical protein
MNRSFMDVSLFREQLTGSDRAKITGIAALCQWQGMIYCRAHARRVPYCAGGNRVNRKS